MPIKNYVNLIEESNKPKKVSVLISFEDFNDYKNKCDDMYSVLNKYVGSEYVKVMLKKEKKMKIINDSKVTCSDEFIKSLKEKLDGNEIVKLENDSE